MVKNSMRGITPVRSSQDRVLLMTIKERFVAVQRHALRFHAITVSPGDHFLMAAPYRACINGRESMCRAHFEK